MKLNQNSYVVTPANAGVHGLLAGRKLNAASSRLRGGDDMGAFQLYRILL
jgi:hypothetical protein